MKRYWPAYLMGAGVLLVIADMIFVSSVPALITHIPPGMEAEVQRNERIAFVVFVAAVGIFLVGAASGIIRLIVRWLK